MLCILVEFQKQSTKGCFCLWSLKNPSYPEYVVHTESGIMTLDFHPSRPYLVVVGLNDGMVAVFDSRLPTKTPIYQSTHVDNKHCGIVWQVHLKLLFKIISIVHFFPSCGKKINNEKH